ncbi:MAG TPA: hypothetical protein VJT68_11180 [Thermoleophilaceae bacterium]|nr:hypothetical protein [Thermoleophilaceae bacterium]
MLILVGLVAAPPARAQDGGGMPAPDFSEPCPAIYPGDSAEEPRIARWMARGAADRGLPHELPVMAGLTESGLQNLRGRSFAGYFGMSRALNTGEYRGFPRNPDLQMRWFTDTAMLVRQRRVAEGRPDPADDPAAYGSWIADVERPARQYRSRYQTHLTEARDLIAGKCSEPSADDTAAPRFRVRIETSQRPLSTGGITLSARCPDHDCLMGAMVEIGDSVRRAAAREPASGGYTQLVLKLPRPARRDLRAGRAVRARVTAIAADHAANTTSRASLVTLRG